MSKAGGCLLYFMYEIDSLDRERQGEKKEEIWQIHVGAMSEW